MYLSSKSGKFGSILARLCSLLSPRMSAATETTDQYHAYFQCYFSLLKYTFLVTLRNIPQAFFFLWLCCSWWQSAFLGQCHVHLFSDGDWPEQLELSDLQSPYLFCLISMVVIKVFPLGCSMCCRYWGTDLLALGCLISTLSQSAFCDNIY